MSESAFEPGFRSVETEYSDRQLEFEGSVPSWLSGRFVRNGPGLFEVDGERLAHWFDGLAMVRQYSFDDGAVSYTSRFPRTESYADALAGRATGQFATDESVLSKLLGWIRRLGPPSPTDNANVHVARLDGELVALTEVPNWVTLDEETLATRGQFTFADTNRFHMTTAHLVEDPTSGAHVGHAVTFGRNHEYRLFRIPAGTRRREVFASIQTDRPAYVHSIGVSGDHAVLFETPLRIDLKRALSPFSEGFFGLLSWEPALGTRVYVVERDGGAVRYDHEMAPFFTFHVVNAFDDGEAVVVDLVAFEDDAIVDGLSFEALANEGFDAAPPGRLVRMRVGPDGVTRERLYDGGMELPTVFREQTTGEHRHVYAQATDREGANGLVKVDTRDRSAREWWERGTYVEEPMPVRAPASADESGVVLAVALDVDRDRSDLLVFDADSLEIRARAPLPGHEPFGFHGRFFPD